MPPHRPYSQMYDEFGNTPLQSQLDYPLGLETLPQAGLNVRTVVGGDGQPYTIADGAVSPRGSKQVLWSSEGFTTTTGIVVPALTTNQKKATNNSSVNLGSPTLAVAAGGGALPAGVTFPSTIDFSPYRAALLLINFTAITGTSMQFELDFLDDVGTPVVYALKTTALTAAGQIILAVGTSVGGFPPASIPTGYGGITVASGTLIYPVQIPLAPQGQIVWTANSVTAATWTGVLYGIS